MSVKLVFQTKGRTRIEVFKNRVLRRIFEPKREKTWHETGEDCIMSFVTCTLHQITEDEMSEACSTHGRDEKCI